MPAGGYNGNTEVMQDYNSGKQFFLDVINLRFDRLGVTKLTMADRMKAASEVMAYTDQAKPKLVEAKHDHSWAQRVRDAEARQSAEAAAAEATAGEGDDDGTRSPTD
jgi:hypothetical protein